MPPDSGQRAGDQMEQSMQAEAFKDARKRTFLNAESAHKPVKSPVPRETRARARQYRLARIREVLVKETGAERLDGFPREEI